MAPERATVGQKTGFPGFHGNGISNPGFPMACTCGGTRYTYLPSFIPIGPSVWPLGREQTDKQTDKSGDWQDLRVVSSAVVPLLAGNSQELSKNCEDIHGTKFPALLSGTNIIELR